MSRLWADNRSCPPWSEVKSQESLKGCVARQRLALYGASLASCLLLSSTSALSPICGKYFLFILSKCNVSQTFPEKSVGDSYSPPIHSVVNSKPTPCSVFSECASLSPHICSYPWRSQGPASAPLTHQIPCTWLLSSEGSRCCRDVGMGSQPLETSSPSVWHTPL